MSRIWRQLAIATNWPLLVAVIVLSLIGVINIWADPRVETHIAGDAQKQLIFFLVGLALIFLMQAVNYQQLGRYSWPFYILSLILLIYTIVPGVPSSGIMSVNLTNGARAWISVVGPFKLQ